MVIINYPYPRYIAIMEDSIIAKSLSNTRIIQVSHDINLILSSLISVLELMVNHPQTANSELIIHSNNQNLVDILKEYSTGNIELVRKSLEIKSKCKVFRHYTIEYKEKIEIPEIKDTQIEIQTIKEMLNTKPEQDVISIVPEDLLFFQFTDIVLRKPVNVIKIDNVPIGKFELRKKQTVFSHKSNGSISMDYSDPTIIATYNNTGKTYAFPPGRIGTELTQKLSLKIN